MRLQDSVCGGPACKFGDAHIYYVLHLLEENGRVCRADLADMLNIGEGSVRKIVDILRGWGLVTVKQAGVSLSDYGEEFLRNIPMRMVQVPNSEYVLGTFQQGVVVCGMEGKITNGMYQRDRGIIAGADGSSVFVMRDNALIMPRSWNMDLRDKEFSSSVRRATGICEGDVLVISGASDSSVAAVSAIAIGLNLL